MNSNKHIPEGYMHTTLGWVPEDWDVKKLEVIADIQQGISKGKVVAENEAIKVPYMRVGNVKDGYIDFAEIKEITIKKSELPKYKLEVNDILITEGGDPDKLGRGGIWKGEVGTCVFQNHLFRIRPNIDILLPGFLYNFFQSYQAKNYFLSCAKQTTGIASINSSQVKATPIPLPSIPEQLAIITILNTCDEGIDKVNQLINHKVNLKKWLVDQLFTGKKRLPDFSKEWKFIPINHIAKEVSIRNKENQKLTVLSCTKYGGLVSSLEYFGRRIFSEDLSTYKIVPRSCFAYATNHIEEGSIGYQAQFETALISPMYTVFKTTGINDDFLFRLLKSHHYIHEYQKRMEGSIDRRGGLRWDEFSKIKIPIPELKEQIAITAVLQNADDELKLLKNHLSHLREQKKGLMQILLTGKKRLIQKY